MPVGIHMTIFEVNPQKARFLSEQFPKADLILGDGTDQDALEEQGLWGKEQSDTVLEEHLRTPYSI